MDGEDVYQRLVDEGWKVPDGELGGALDAIGPRAPDKDVGRTGCAGRKDPPWRGDHVGEPRHTRRNVGSGGGSRLLACVAATAPLLPRLLSGPGDPGARSGAVPKGLKR